MLKTVKTKYLVVTSLAYLLSANLSLAQMGGDGSPVKIGNPIRHNNISDFLSAILGLVVKIGIPIVTIAIIYTGFMFVSARGNATKIEEAKRAFVYVMIGAAIVLGAQALQIVISGTIADIRGSL